MLGKYGYPPSVAQAMWNANQQYEKQNPGNPADANEFGGIMQQVIADYNRNSGLIGLPGMGGASPNPPTSGYTPPTPGGLGPQMGGQNGSGLPGRTMNPGAQQGGMNDGGGFGGQGGGDQPMRPGRMLAQGIYNGGRGMPTGQDVVGPASPMSGGVGIQRDPSMMGGAFGNLGDAPTQGFGGMGGFGPPPPGGPGSENQGGGPLMPGGGFGVQQGGGLVDQGNTPPQPAMSNGAPPWAAAMAQGQNQAAFTGLGDAMPLPNPMQWQNMLPTEKQAYLQIAQSQGLSPQDFLQEMQASQPEWGAMQPTAAYRSV